MSDANVQAFPANESDNETLSGSENDDAKTSSESAAKTVQGVSGERLKSFIERVERLEEEKTAIAEDIKDVYSEAKAVGYETKIIRKIVSQRKMDTEKRREEEELLDLYKAAIGMAE